MRGDGHLRVPAGKLPTQGVRGRRHLPAPAPKEPMQGLRGGEHLPEPVHQEQCKECRDEAGTSMPAGLEEQRRVPRLLWHPNLQKRRARAVQVATCWPPASASNSVFSFRHLDTCCW